MRFVTQFAISYPMGPGECKRLLYSSGISANISPLHHVWHRVPRMGGTKQNVIGVSQGSVICIHFLSGLETDVLWGTLHKKKKKKKITEIQHSL